MGFGLSLVKERTRRVSLTVVGEAGLAETHDEVDLHFIGCHRLGAYRALEPW